VSRKAGNAARFPDSIMPRFLLRPEDWKAGVLRGDEARHFAQVLRGKAGDRITVFDGAGRRAAANVLQVSREQVSLELSEAATTAPTPPRVTLAQAIPKGKTMDLIVQKAVELGVAAIQPLVTRHTVVQPDGGKAEKWTRTALEACKQCGQDTLPRIDEPLPFDRWLEREPGAPSAAGQLRIVASLAAGAMPLRELLRDARDVTAVTDLTLLVGPEGDFSPEETRAALDAGFHPATLGSIVLRVETAALYCLSAVRYEFAG